MASAHPRLNIRRALRLAIAEPALLLLGWLFIHREIWQFHAATFQIEHWQEGILLPLSAIDGAITGAFASPVRNVENKPSYRGQLAWGVPLFLVLYVASAVLCERLSFTVLPGEIWRWLGVIIFAAGVAVRLWSQATAPSELVAVRERLERLNALPAAALTESAQAQTENQPPQAAVQPADDQPLAVTMPFPAAPYKFVRYPESTGRLLSLIGLPLCFAAWMPLLAIPGIIVLLKWHISDQEAFRISQLGDPYLDYRKHTWHIVPYLY